MQASLDKETYDVNDDDYYSDDSNGVTRFEFVNIILYKPIYADQHYDSNFNYSVNKLSFHKSLMKPCEFLINRLDSTKNQSCYRDDQHKYNQNDMCIDRKYDEDRGDALFYDFNLLSTLISENVHVFGTYVHDH